MAKPPINPLLWKEVRQQWEADPALTFSDLLPKLGCSVVAISVRAKREGWVKIGTVRRMADAAQIRADEKQEIVTFLASVEVRSSIIEQHRADWRDHRRLFGLEGIAKDFEKGKSAKISSEMISIRQKGERMAYGLEDSTPAADGNSHEFLKELSKLLPN